MTFFKFSPIQPHGKRVRTLIARMDATATQGKAQLGGRCVPKVSNEMTGGVGAGIFGTPMITIKSGFMISMIVLIKLGVGAQTATGSIIQIAANRYFVTGILANGASLMAAAGFEGLTLLQSDILIIIHELLHFVGVVGSDDASQRIVFPNGDTVIGSAGVTAEVRKKCF